MTRACEHPRRARRRARGLVALGLGLALAGGASAIDRVERRGGMPDVTGTLLRYDEGGVTVRTTSGLDVEVGWDRIRSVDAARPPADLRRLLERGDDLWRARVRLQRGAYDLAEAGFARHFEALAGGDDRLSLLVAEGLLRCRLVRGANAEAVVPMVHAVRLRARGLELPWDGELDPVIDARTGLCPALPPAWLADEALERALDDVTRLRLADGVALATARRYADAMRRTLDPSAAPADPGDAPTAGLAFLDAVLAAESGDDPLALARTAEVGAAESADLRWREAWARLAVGVAAANTLVDAAGDVAQAERTDATDTVLDLLHVTARFAADLPYAAGLALREAAAILDAVGRGEEADRLRLDLRQRWAGHPLATTRLDARGNDAG